ncbi:unnamed protein product [Prorocentrum cordatum]|uniref:Tubulin-specific chaperone A n=1 Tax=Prorocentrum cordatum TaxID=2364126 RepID=A0ABN9PC55_9DINO|nr:unnamed protein product [Polarella glacialis]
MASHLDSIPGAYRKEGGPGYGSVGAGGVVKLDDGDYYVEANEKLQEVDHQVSAAERLREQDESEVAAFQHDRHVRPTRAFSPPSTTLP